MYRVLKAVFPVILVGCIHGCGDRSFLPDPSSESAQVTKGFPAVVRVISKEGCTGTFVSKVAVLTARHCIDDTYLTLVKWGYQEGDDWIEGSATALNTISLGTGAKGDYNDIAVIILKADNDFKEEPYEIASSVSARTTVRLVGYGEGENGDFPMKRTGTNVIFEKADFLELISVPAMRKVRGAYNRVGAYKGDSGAPLFTEPGPNRKIVGIVHGGARRGSEELTEAVDVTSPQVKTFLENTNREHQLRMRGVK